MMVRPSHRRIHLNRLSQEPGPAQITRVYDTYAHAQAVFDELRRSGFADAEISLVANKPTSEKFADVKDASGTATGAEVGAAVGGGAGLLAGLGVMAIPGIGPVVAAGWLAATLLGAVAGAATGGLVGALTDAGVSEEDAGVYAETVRRGGTMVAVKSIDSARINMAQAIMDRNSPIDLTLRAAEYRREGWKGYDPAAAPYPDAAAMRNPRT
jgi:hypothetical protein